MRVRVGDARLFVDMEGPGLVPDGPRMRERPTLLCLHGGPGQDHTVFRPAFSALSEVAQVMYVDLRGHGRSDRCDPADVSLKRWADDVAGLCDVLGLDRPVVLGTSFGGYVAMTLAAAHPDVVGKLVLVSTSPRGTGDPERQRNVYAAFARRGGPEAERVVRAAFSERSPEALAEYLRVCGPLYTRHAATTDAVARRISNPALVPMFEAPGNEGVTFDIRDKLGQVRCPVLVVGGADDPITPPPEQELIARLLPTGSVTHHIVAGSGHGVVRDRPDRFFQLVTDFLAS